MSKTNVNLGGDRRESPTIDRRDMLNCVDTFSLGAISPYILKAAIDSYVHEDWEYGDPSAREELAHVRAIEKIEEENELDLHIVEPGLDPEESIIFEENLDNIEQKLSGLKDELIPSVSGYNIEIPEEYSSEIRETPVKQSRELTEEIGSYIDEEGVIEGMDDDDIVMYLGDFRSELGDYVGSGHADTNSGAIANKNTEI